MAAQRCRECRMTVQHKLQCSRRNEPLAVGSPFPLEVVERVAAAIAAVVDAQPHEWNRREARAAISVIADYLRSEEARAAISAALDARGPHDDIPSAVISALLGEKP